MNIKLKWRPLLLASMMTASLSVSQATFADDCMGLLKTMLTSFDEKMATKVDLDTHLNHRNFVAQFAKKNNIPVFLKLNSRGEEIPVILLNAKTAPKLQKYLEYSFGTQVALQKDWNNDHGLLRAGEFIIDLDSPGARGFGEIEQTGLAWKPLYGYLERRAYGSSPTLEVSYLLTPNEKSVVDYYQKVRRAALFRVKFTFGGHNGPDYPNLLKNGGEHCFIFCKAQGVYSQTSEIKQRLMGVGVTDPDTMLKNAKAKMAIEKIQNLINQTGPKELNSNMLAHPKTLALFDEFYPKSVKTDKQKLEILNWIISYDSSKKYGQVMSDLGISGDYGVGDAMNKRASAIFVYDEAADASAFKDANYTNQGKMVNWPTTKQYPVK